MVLPEPRKLLFVNANPGSMEEYNSCLHILPGVDQACRQHGLGMDLLICR